jgi:hypothetical protein
LDACIQSTNEYALFNYVDTPDYSMNELVQHVRHKLTGKNHIGFRLPYWLGLFLGYIADGVVRISGRKLPISSIRVKKFVSSTEFTSAKASLDAFEQPFSLAEGVERTLQSEFIDPDPEREIFYTE